MIPKTVFIVEWSGCECGGACEVAFTERQAAEWWVMTETAKQRADPPVIREYYEVKEVELR